LRRNAPKIVLVMATIFGLVASVSADVKDMLFCLPGFPGTTSQAQPYIDKMLRHLEGKLALAQGTMTGTYLPDGDKSEKKLAGSKPDLALVGPSILAGSHKAMGMKVIAKVEINGRGQETYSVITAKGGPSSLADLAGKTVSGAVVHDEKYVHNVLLDRKLAAGNLTLMSQKRPLKSLRDVARGKVDAAIVDRSVVDHMSELDFAGDLQVIYTSVPVPAPAVVVMGEGKAHAAKLKSVLVGLCKRADGKDLCKTLTITSINPASDADYKSLYKRYNRK